jgi:hypothetical protein
MTYEGIFDETDCKKELKRAKKYINNQADIIFALEKEVEEKHNEIIIIKERLKSEKLIRNNN